jgi:predicted alpha/beta hydrolase
MMADRRTLWHPNRPTIAATLRDHGYSTLLCDLRGHGASGPRAHEGGHWHYDELVADTAHWLALARDLAHSRPIAWLGHSLFGHASLAWFGQHPGEAPAAFVGLAVNVWQKRHEPSRRVWAVKRAVTEAVRPVVRLVGRVPARALRFASNDESSGYWSDLQRFVASDTWTARDGADYRKGLASLTMPALFGVSRGDRLFTRPADGRNFALMLPNPEVWELGAPDCPVAMHGPPPTHMGLVTDRRSRPLWEHVAHWLDGHLNA